MDKATVIEEESRRIVMLEEIQLVHKEKMIEKDTR